MISMNTGAEYWRTMALAAVVSLLAITKSMAEQLNPIAAPIDALQNLKGILL